MFLSKSEFDVLSSIAVSKEKISQSELQKITGYPLSTVDKIINDLNERKLIENGTITSLGLDLLEPYRVKRAVFFAAGFGVRMVPVTLNTPKPLVRVNGKRIIDTLIDACLEADIEEIYIVRGYLYEQFDQLLYKYPMIKFLENPAYNEANNISSAVVARHLLQNSYIFEADLFLFNPKIITKYHYQSDVLGIWKEQTDDWCFDVDENGRITVEKIGGLNTYQCVGIFYLNSADGKKMAEHLKEAYLMPGGKEKFWDIVPFHIYKNEYNIFIRPCNDDDIVEIDSFDELKQIDKAYDV